VARDFVFDSGQSLAELRIGYTTIGDPSGLPVLVLHGTGNSGAGLLTQDFAHELFGAGQPLDAKKHFIILPDAIGAGRSSKPSDGLGADFPGYSYADMVRAQYRLAREGLKLDRLRLIIGNSMGGAHAWLWATEYPDLMDAVVPMAVHPTPMSGRNWMMRRLIIDAIRNDPDWNNGHYNRQPRAAQFASVFFGVATNGGARALERLAPNRQAADALLDARLRAPFAADANDVLYQWESLADYDASGKLEAIRAPVLAINSEDDERYPPELGIMPQIIKRVPKGTFHLIPASAETCGHGTTLIAKFWKSKFAEWMAAVGLAR
jgi:homoserine O-acetyltransferase